MIQIIINEEDISYINNRLLICSTDENPLTIDNNSIPTDMIEYFSNHKRVDTEFPSSISKTQCVVLLYTLGIYDELLLKINASPLNKLIWESCHQLDRESQLVKQFAIEMNYDDTMMDEFFINASKILV